MKRVLTSIWFLALIVAVPVIVFLPPIFDKYNIDLLEKNRKLNSSDNIFFKDLNNDGEIERIEAYQSHNNLFSFQCFDQNNRLIDQYNFPNFYRELLSSLYFFDINEDGLMEVYGFTHHNDSVFLSWVEPLDTLPKFKTRFITTINTEKRKTIDVRMRQLCFFDFDGDDNVEIAFSLEVGYNWFPRKMYVYHPEIDSLNMSENFGSHFSELMPFDSPVNGETQLLCVSSSAGNIPPNINVEYKDDRPRIFVFNNDLEFALNPIEFPKGLGARIYPIFTDKKKGELITLYHNFSSENTMTFIAKMQLHNSSILSDTLFLPTIFNKTIRVEQGFNNEIIIYGKQGKIYQVSEELQIVDSTDLSFSAEHELVACLDVYKDGVPEFYILDENGKQLLVYLDKFQETVELDFEERFSIPYVVESSTENQFLVLGTGFYFIYELSRNPYYYAKYPFYVIIYFVVVAFIWLLQAARMKQLQEKLELQSQVRELQLRTLKNQLDPHFIFNTFNTIASVVKQGRNEEAYNVMVRFSKMVRLNLDSSDKIYTTLKGELDFITDYLAIQKFRFKDMFEYKIDIKKNVNLNIPVPKLLIQIHVENALKHGIRPAKNGGLLVIRLRKDSSLIRIEIEDNGIGREKSKELRTDGTGIGLKAIQQILELNNQMRKNRISQEIFDLKREDGSSAGTKVLLKITRSTL